MSDGEVIASFGGAAPEVGSFEWSHAPTRVEREDGAMVVHMDPKHDFWRKTYYEPEMIADNGHLFHCTLPANQKAVLETRMTLHPVNQFDQAGLMLRVDSTHWIKTGIEYTDGSARLSCVVTNDFSDWSTATYRGAELFLRLYRLGESVVVEAKDSEEAAWEFIRIAHVGGAGGEVRAGFYCAAPGEAAGGNVRCEFVRAATCDGFHHST